ncbi:transposase [Bradyrhizobium japonicum]
MANAGMRGRPIAPLILSQQARTYLERQVRHHRVTRSLYERCRAILRCAHGLPSKSVAAELGLHEHTVGKWRRRVLKNRCDGLLDEARPGRPRTINDDQVAAVIERTLRTTPANATHWSIRSHHLRLNALPKSFDIMYDVLAVLALQFAEQFLCPLGTLCMRSSILFTASQQSFWAGTFTMKSSNFVVDSHLSLTEGLWPRLDKSFTNESGSIAESPAEAGPGFHGRLLWSRLRAWPSFQSARNMCTCSNLPTMVESRCQPAMIIRRRRMVL